MKSSLLNDLFLTIDVAEVDTNFKTPYGTTQKIDLAVLGGSGQERGHHQFELPIFHSACASRLGAPLDILVGTSWVILRIP